ncbi:MAG: hypothetical protein ACXWT3_11980 [Methylococcaceae bacterium]
MTYSSHSVALAVIHKCRHTRREAGIQLQECETMGLHACSLKHMCNGQVTIHGIGFRPPCRNDGISIARPDLRITMGAGA